MQRNTQTIWLRLACAAVLLAGSASVLADPYFSLDSLDDWNQAMSEHIVPLEPTQWDQYMDEWMMYTEEGDPYPSTLFQPAQLYTYDEGGPFEAPGLVMAWGPDPVPGDQFASAWVYDYGPDPNLANAIITVAVLPPSWGGSGITQISFGIQDINGNTRSWYWNVGPGQTIPWDVSTYIVIDCSQTGAAAATPVADGYMNNPAFNIANAQLFIADENGSVVDQIPVPPPGGPPSGLWNYWHNLTVEPKLGETKWEQYPSFNPDPNQPFPDCFWGWDEYSEYLLGPIAADDFLCQTPLPITDIHWWGSYPGWWQWEPPQNAPQTFHIGIWTDVALNDPGNMFPYSHPGRLIKEWWVARSALNEHVVGCDYHPMMLLNPETTFRYDFLIPQSDWFYQEDGVNVYWLSIAPVNAAGADFYPWGWLTRQPVWNDAAIRINQPQAPVIGSVFQYGDPIMIGAEEAWDLAFVLTTTFEEPEPYLIEFSLDIGSDTEMSDPQRDGDEGFDPGDVYWWQGAPVNYPGRDGFKDDTFIFSGFDPWPDPPDPNYTTAAPVGYGTPQDYYEWFDLDGHDQIELDLTEIVPLEEPLTHPISSMVSQCIYDPYHLLISFDDDMRPGYITGDVPVAAPSPAGVSSYGSTATVDEVIAIDLMPAATLPLPIAAVMPFADEVTVHGSLAPNPDTGDDKDDDDVDSLDIVPDRQLCPNWYFSPDHEANLTLDPGAIYLATAAGPVKVIDEIHYGLPDDVDIDAFEFVYLTDPSGLYGLGVIFSVDEDDPVTPGDESGGLPPDMLFGSLLMGTFFQVSDPLGDDIDAVTCWRDTLIEGPPCLDPGDSNCDGLVNNGDIDPFVVAVSAGQAAWEALPTSTCDFFCANDVNNDGLVNNGDIDPFVALLSK